MIIRNLTNETLKFQSQGQIVSIPANGTADIPEKVAKAGLLATFGNRVQVVNMKAIEDEAKKVLEEIAKVATSIDTLEDVEVITEEEAKILEERAILNIPAPEVKEDKETSIPEECKECYADGKTPAEENCKNCDKKVVTEEAKEVVAEVKEVAPAKTKEAPKKSTSKGKTSKKNNK